MSALIKENLKKKNDVGPDFSRRKYPRRAMKKTISFLFMGRYEMATSVEIGEGGLAFEFQRKLPEGASIILNFQIPNGGFVSSMAEIRFSKPLSETNEPQQGGSQKYFYGCLFKNVTFEHKREIRTFVSSRF